MALPEAVKKIVDESERLLAEHEQASQSEDAQQGSEQMPDGQESGTETNFEQSDSGTDAAQKPDESPGGDHWEQKYKVLQGKYDTEMRLLSGQVAELVRANSLLMARITQLEHGNSPHEEKSGEGKATDNADPFASFVAKLQADGFDDAAAEFSKGIGQLMAKLHNVTQNQAALHGTHARSQQEKFWASVQQAVPDWQAVNTDPAFHQWLLETDMFTGKKRDDLLKEAGQALDAGRVCAFFVAFKGRGGASVPQGGPNINKRVSPSTSGGVSAPDKSGKKIWTPEEIAKFYQQVANNTYPGTRQEREKIDNDIISAQSEGRIRIPVR